MSASQYQPSQPVERVSDLPVNTPWDALYLFEEELTDFKDPDFIEEFEIPVDTKLCFVYGFKDSLLVHAEQLRSNEIDPLCEELADFVEYLSRDYVGGATVVILLIYTPGEVTVSNGWNHLSDRDRMLIAVLPVFFSGEGLTLIDIVEMSDTDVSSYHAQGFIEQPLLIEIGNQPVNYDRPYPKRG